MGDPERASGPYKVVELTDVTDAAVEKALNDWSGKGYRLESVHFVTHPGSRRPSMAFLFFTARAPEAGRP